MKSGKFFVVMVDDEKNLTDGYTYILQNSGFEVIAFNSSKDFAYSFELLKDQIDIVILDLMIDSFGGGEDLLAQIKKYAHKRRIYTIVLSAMMDEKTKVRLLDAGADDYCIKSISPKEFVSRVKALARIVDENQANSQVKIGNDSVYVMGKRLDLTLNETKLLNYFIENQDEFVSRFDIEKYVLRRDIEIETKTVDVLISRLKKKLKLLDDNYAEIIINSKNEGWLFKGFENA